MNPIVCALLVAPVLHGWVCLAAGAREANFAPAAADVAADPTETPAAPQPGYTALQLADGLYELRIDVGYIVKVLASIGPDGVLLVDAGPREHGQALREALARLGGGEPRIVILPHSHDEHWGGIRELGPAPLYVGHENLRRRLRSGPFLFLDLPEGLLPRLAISDTLTIHFNDEEIRIRSFAGAHDDSDLVVWFTRSQVAFVGALVTAGHLPTVDGSTGDIRRYPEITRRVLDYLPPEVKLVPGHGEDAGRAEGIRFLGMLEETAARVRAEMAKGTDPEAMAEADLLAPWQSWEVSYSDRAYWLRALCDGHSGAAAARKALKTIHEPLHAAFKEGGPDAAVRKFQELKAEHPTEYRLDDRSVYGIAVTLAGEGRNSEAIPFFELALREFPAGRYCEALLDGLSRSCQAVGDADRAVQCLRRLLELDPGNEDAARRLEELEGHRR